jgi:hypothetical protein
MVGVGGMYIYDIMGGGIVHLGAFMVGFDVGILGEGKGCPVFVLPASVVFYSTLRHNLICSSELRI